MVYIRFNMPRKTKKQKIVSDYRRRLTELEFRAPTSARPVHEAHITKSMSEPKRKDIDEIHLTETKRFIAQDLRKTVLWSCVAISVEVVLYFVTYA